MRQTGTSALLIVLPLIFVLTILAIGAGTLLGGNNAEVGSILAFGQRPAVGLHAAPAASLEAAAASGQEEFSKLVSFRSVALGFALDYPFGWRKKEKTLEVIFSPSANGFDPMQVKDISIWIGIPADNRVEPGEVLQAVAAGFPPTTQILSQGSLYFAAQNWLSAELAFESEAGAGPGRAIIAATSKNNVGYFLVASAPAGQWDAFQPLFHDMIGSFEFVAEAVIPPTPTGPPPPTPTATPTPIIYVVQPGDTLSHIAANYGVTIEALQTRNDIDPPESLRAGQKLVIPIKRQR